VKAKYLVVVFIVILVYAVSLFYAGEKSLEELRKDPLNITPVFGYVMIVTFETMFVLLIIEVIFALNDAEESLNRYWQNYYMVRQNGKRTGVRADNRHIGCCNNINASVSAKEVWRNF